jgi:hypothetical protein
MTSYRPKDDSTQIDFSHEALWDCFVPETQRGQSNMADLEKTALGSETLNWMEQVVHWGNMQKAWKAVRRNQGAPGPDGIHVKEFPAYFYQSIEDMERACFQETNRPRAPARLTTRPDPHARWRGRVARATGPLSRWIVRPIQYWLRQNSRSNRVGYKAFLVSLVVHRHNQGICRSFSIPINFRS